MDALSFFTVYWGRSKGSLHPVVHFRHQSIVLSLLVVRQKDKARGSCRRGGEGEGGGRLSLSDAPHFKPSMTKHEAAAAAAGQRRSDLIFEAPNKHAFSVPGALNTEEPGPHTLLPSLPFGFSSPQAMQRLLLLQQGPTYRATLPSLFLSLFL